MPRQRGDRVPLRLQPVIGFAWLGILVLTGTLLVLGRDVAIPLALAILVWQLVNAIADQVRRVRILGQTAPRWARLLIALTIMLAVLWLVIDLILSNAAAVAAAAPTYQANLQRLLAGLPQRLGLDTAPTLAELALRIDLPALVRNLTGTLTALVGSAGLVLLYVAFILLEQESFERKIEALLPDPADNQRLRAVLADIERRIETYLWIKTLVSAATGILSWAVLRLVGVAFPEFWGLVVFMLNFIPVIGSLFGVALPVLLTIVQFAAWGPVLTVTVLLGAIQFSLGNVLEPRLMGTSLNLSPLVILLSLAVWGSIWGIAGMVLSVPLTVMLLIVLAHFERTRPVAILLSATGKVDV